MQDSCFRVDALTGHVIDTSERAVAQEWAVIRDFLARHDASKGQRPARRPYLRSRDKEFAARFNAAKFPLQTVAKAKPSSIYNGQCEHAACAIRLGEKFGYHPDDIAAFLVWNYVKGYGVKQNPLAAKFLKKYRNSS